MVKRMLMQLQLEKLEVMLMPAPEQRYPGHMVRTARNRNPYWYRKLCNMNESARGRQRLLPDTRIKRRSILSVLTQLVKKGRSRSKYAPQIIDLAIEEIDWEASQRSTEEWLKKRDRIREKLLKGE